MRHCRQLRPLEWSRFKNTLERISEGCNLWDRTNEGTLEHCLHVLESFAAQSSNQQNNERFVKATAYLKRTGKSEKKANIYAIASNGFTAAIYEELCSPVEELPDSQAANINLHYEEPLCNQHVVKKGENKVVKFHKTVLEKLNKLAIIVTSMGSAYPNLFNQIYKNLTGKEFAQLEKRKKESSMNSYERDIKFQIMQS